MKKIFLNFKPVDVPATIDRLNIDDQAKEDASFGMPLSDTDSMTKKEIEIVQEINSAYNAGTSNKSIADLEESLQNAASLRQADGHDGQISSLKINLQTLYAESKERLAAHYAVYRKDKDNLEFFKKDNKRLEDADLTSNWTKALFVFSLIFFAAIEISTNTSLLMNAISGGVMGALSLAGVVALVNIFLSFLYGRYAISWMHHINQSIKLRGWLVTPFYVFLIFYINVAMGVTRTLSAQATQTFDQDGLQQVAVEAAWPFDNLATNTLESNGLIILGLIFAIVAIIEGVKWDEIYPGFGKISRKAAASEKRFEELRDQVFDLLQSQQKAGNDQITRFKNKREEANKNWANNIDSVQKAFADYENWVKSLTVAGQNLLQQYRSVNKVYRSPAVPRYFNENYDFEFEKSASDRFRSLVSSNLTDKAKDEQFMAANKIIIGEYNNAIIQLNNIYSEIIEQFQNYLARLR